MPSFFSTVTAPVWVQALMKARVGLVVVYPVQTPAAQVAGEGHAAPQEPQLVGLVVVSTHWPLQ
jgi:hypothetical protein